MAIADKLRTILSVRPSFRRKIQVVYRAPGFLHGTYMIEKSGRNAQITHTDLVRHAIDMRYGAGHEHMIPQMLGRMNIEIQAIYR